MYTNTINTINNTINTNLTLSDIIKINSSSLLIPNKLLPKKSLCNNINIIKSIFPNYNISEAFRLINNKVTSFVRISN